MKDLLRTNDITLIAYVQTILEAQGIDFFMFDTNMSILDGSLGILPQRIMVADRDHFIAAAILNDHEIEPIRE